VWVQFRVTVEAQHKFPVYALPAERHKALSPSKVEHWGIDGEVLVSAVLVSPAFQILSVFEVELLVLVSFCNQTYFSPFT